MRSVRTNKIVVSYLILTLVCSSFSYAQSDTTSKVKWYKKFQLGCLSQNYSYADLGRYQEQYAKNIGQLNFGAVLGYDKVLLCAGYTLGYDYQQDLVTRIVQKSEGAFFKALWYPVSRKNFKYGIGVYFTSCDFTLNYQDRLGLKNDYRIVSGNFNFLFATEYKLYKKLSITGEAHFGGYTAYNFDLNSHADDGYNSTTFGFTVGLKYMFLHYDRPTELIYSKIPVYDPRN